MSSRYESVASPLFDRLKTEGWSVVEDWKANREPETNHLEFKRKTNPKTKTLDDDDRDEIAKTLSAFGNSGGGLLVLGVVAGGGNKKGQAFDRVQHVEPLDELEAFGGALEREVRTFTDPMIAGLEVHPIFRDGKSGAGVLAIFVPESEGGPHRAVRASSEVNDRYYMRTAAGAQTMGHVQLAAMMQSEAQRFVLDLEREKATFARELERDRAATAVLLEQFKSELTLKAEVLRQIATKKVEAILMIVARGDDLAVRAGRRDPTIVNEIFEDFVPRVRRTFPLFRRATVDRLSLYIGQLISFAAGLQGTVANEKVMAAMQQIQKATDELVATARDELYVDAPPAGAPTMAKKETS